MKTLKLLINQVLQSQGVNKIPWGVSFKAVVPQEEGGSGMGQRKNCNLAVFWMAIHRWHRGCLGTEFLNSQKKRKREQTNNGYTSAYVVKEMIRQQIQIGSKMNKMLLILDTLYAKMNKISYRVQRTNITQSVSKRISIVYTIFSKLRSYLMNEFI